MDTAMIHPPCLASRKTNGLLKRRFSQTGFIDILNWRDQNTAAIRLPHGLSRYNSITR